MIYLISFIIITIIIICQCFVPPLPHLRDAARARHVSRRNGRLTSITGSWSREELELTCKYSSGVEGKHLSRWDARFVRVRLITCVFGNRLYLFDIDRLQHAAMKKLLANSSLFEITESEWMSAVRLSTVCNEDNDSEQDNMQLKWIRHLLCARPWETFNVVELFFPVQINFVIVDLLFESAVKHSHSFIIDK